MMTDEERQELCDALRHTHPSRSISATAADEIERLAALAQSDAEPKQDVRAHLELMAGQKLTVEMDDCEKWSADYEGAYNDLVKCARATLTQSNAEPDTSDIPEVSKEWFKKARLVMPQSDANLDAVVTTCPKCGKPVTSYWHKDNTGCESRPEYGLIADAVFHAECLPSDAQPDAKPVRVTDEMVKAASDILFERTSIAFGGTYMREALEAALDPEQVSRYTAPPRPDASMGLIEAAEWHDARASAFIEAEGDPGARYRLVQWHMNCAKELRDLATERIGKL